MPGIRHIVLVGCGQMGSRHLQALAKLECALRVRVIEPSAASRETGKARVAEALAALDRKSELQIEWLEQPAGADERADLTIVATSAPGRVEILDRLLKAGHKRFLLEKMVCQSARDYRHLLDAFAEHRAKGWLNCTRRYYPFYRKLLGLLPHNGPLLYHVMAGNLGLGCNAIHFLDLFAAFSDNGREVRLNGEFLSPEILPNRRGTDLVEFAGTILASTTKGDFASISFSPAHDGGVVSALTTPHHRILADEGRSRAWLASRATDWAWTETPFQELYTSQLTTDIARSILFQDSCDLPTLESSYPLHVELFRIFNRHLRRVTARTSRICPIT